MSHPFFRGLDDIMVFAVSIALCTIAMIRSQVPFAIFDIAVILSQVE